MNTSKNSQSKTAIITGSGRGIGKETAILSAKHVTSVVVCSRTESEIDSVVKEIEDVNSHDYNNYILKKDNNNHLEVIINGGSIPVPARIGIDPSLWKYHDLDKYGMQSMNMVMPGMAPLHTHDDSGTVHIETSVNRNYTLGEFLKIWGIELDGKSVKASLDGKPIADFRSHILTDTEWIKLEIEANKRI